MRIDCTHTNLTNSPSSHYARLEGRVSPHVNSLRPRRRSKRKSRRSCVNVVRYAHTHTPTNTHTHTHTDTHTHTPTQISEIQANQRRAQDELKKWQKMLEEAEAQLPAQQAKVEELTLAVRCIRDMLHTYILYIYVYMCIYACVCVVCSLCCNEFPALKHTHTHP